jgi:hypothetical protein
MRLDDRLDARKLRTRKVAEIEHAYRENKNPTAAAIMADVCRKTAVKYFEEFAAASVPRKRKAKRTWFGRRSGMNEYAGPDWIGESAAENQRPKNGTAGRGKF